MHIQTVHTESQHRTSCDTQTLSTCAEANPYTAEKMAKYFAHFWGGKGETSMDNIKKPHENTLAFELQVLGFSICMLEMIKVLGKKNQLLENH